MEVATAGSSDDVLVSEAFADDSDVAAVLAMLHSVLTAKSTGGHRFEAQLDSGGIEIPVREAVTFCEPTVTERLRQLRDRAVMTMQQFFCVPGELLGFSLATEMRSGACHLLHADAEMKTPEGWRPNHTPWLTRVGLIYLNTSGVDYQGGSLRLPALGRTIEPRAGLLVAFPSGRRHVHEVTRVEAGVRRALAIWLTADPAHAERWTV
jgi:hypothetical protein